MNINTVWNNTVDSIASVKDKVIDKYNNTNNTNSKLFRSYF